MSIEQLTGTVQFYNLKKGFGFIKPDVGGDDVFLHHSTLDRSLQSQLREGSRIQFGVEIRKKGPSAIEVSLLQGEALRVEVSQVAPASNGNGISTGADGNGFKALGLINDLLRAVKDAGYTEPTPIQKQAIPQVLAGRDVLGCAQTGTGKTAAFSLPMLQQLADTSGKSKRVIRTLILAPTRELALQISTDLNVYARYLNLSNAVIYGGVNQNPQVKALRKGVDILVATPGRLLDLMGQGHVDLSRVEILVLDEADRMLDMGFIHDVKRIIKQVPQKRQVLLFSATMSRDVMDFADGLLHNPVEVSVSPKQVTTELVEQAVLFVATKQKQNMLEQLLKEPDVKRALVFTRTKHGANRVVKNLTKRGIKAEPIHGNKSQSARQAALKNFRTGKTRVLVATDVASRGIDVDDISHVIQYDLPNEPETYVHRIGRTGRAGSEGIALALCADDERSYLKAIERLTRQHIPVIQEYSQI